MSRICPRTIAIVLGFSLMSGCVRHSVTRVYLHGEVVSENGLAIPNAVVRLGERETVTDPSGHYRFLILERCMRVGVGTAGVSNDLLEGFAERYQPGKVGFHIETAELIGLSSCPRDTDKYLRLTLVPAANP